MKILYTCSYSAGISGVWNRVENLAKNLKKHKIFILSSDIIPHSTKKSKHYEKKENIEFYRFPVKRKISENSLVFIGKAFSDTIRKIKPDIIDCQTYRHPEATLALSVANKLKIPCIITTHAPFVKPEIRGRILAFFADVYDFVIGKRILNKYSKIIAITKWELPFLRKLGVKPDKILYIPNGIPDRFFVGRTAKKKKSVLFLGRITKVKDLETLLKAFSVVENKDKEARLQLVGPLDKDYGLKLISLIKKLRIKNVEFKPPVFDLDKKIKLFQEADIFVLPSRREGMPQSLIEAMASNCKVIASDIEACRELINSRKGLLFRTGDEKDLAEKILYCLKNPMAKQKKAAKFFAEKFRWSRIAGEMEKVYQRLSRN